MYMERESRETMVLATPEMPSQLGLGNYGTWTEVDRIMMWKYN